MVVGNGMIAHGFKHHDTSDNVLIFASGVSNSKEQAEIFFEQEKRLLEINREQNSNKLLVYFSTCSVFDPDQNQTKYVLHKLNLERYIENFGAPYLIFRVSNVAGVTTNKATIFTYLINGIKNQDNFKLWKNASRNIIDLTDVVALADYFIADKIHHQKKINIANPVSFPVPFIVKEIEEFLTIKGCYDLDEKGVFFDIDTSEIMPAIHTLGLTFDNNYIERVLKKYFTN